MDAGGNWDHFPFTGFSFLFVTQFVIVLFPPSDFTVKVVEVSDSSQQKMLRGHEAPVLSVSFDPKDEFLVGNSPLMSGTTTLRPQRRLVWITNTNAQYVLTCRIASV